MTRKEALLAAGSILCSLLLGEAALRWLLPVQYRRTQSHRARTGPAFRPPINAYDPEIGWVLSPASIVSRNAGLSDAVFSISHGERLTSPSPHSGPRIVATGCSFTFGHGVTDQDSWPWIVQEHLPEDHVVNVAASGYGTDQALMAAERQVARFPGAVSTVVLGFADFQIERNRCPQSYLAQIYPSGKPEFVQTGAGVRYKRLIGFWTFGGVGDATFDRSVLLSRTMNLVADQAAYRIPDHSGARQLTAALIVDFARRFQAHGVKLVVLVLPYLDDQADLAKADRRFVVDRLRAAAIPVLAVDIPRRPDGRIDPRQFAVGVHPNRQFNLLLADQLARFLSTPEPGMSASAAHESRAQ
jgi:hypothetical protein